MLGGVLRALTEGRLVLRYHVKNRDWGEIFTVAHSYEVTREAFEPQCSRVLDYRSAATTGISRVGSLCGDGRRENRFPSPYS